MKELNWVMRWKGTGGQNLRWMVKGRLPQGSHTGLEAIPVTGAGGGGYLANTYFQGKKQAQGISA